MKEASGCEAHMKAYPGQHETCLKKGEGWYSLPPSPLSRSGSCSRHISAAMSQACHIGCWCVGGRRG